MVFRKKKTLTAVGLQSTKVTLFAFSLWMYLYNSSIFIKDGMSLKCNELIFVVLHYVVPLN
jgi:hypothetical protein